MIKIEQGSMDETWMKYGLMQTGIIVNGDENFKAIVRNDKLVTVTGKNYELLPNEEALTVADEAAKLAGLVPFNEFEGEWICRMNEHTIYNKDQTQMHALYASNDSYEVGNETMRLGVGVHNSIDRSMGFGCGVFTFRRACSNMVFAGFKGYAQEFDERRTLQHIYRRHTVGLKDVATDLTNVILKVMESTKYILKTYHEMAEEQITKELLDKFKRSRLPKSMMPDFVVEEDARTQILSNPITEWQMYNDVTQRIWHKNNDVRTKLIYFNVLHHVMPLPRIR